MRKLPISCIALIIAILSCSTVFAGPSKNESYATVTVIQGKGQTEILIHRGGEGFDDKIVKTEGEDSDEITQKREQEYNSVIDVLNELATEGYEVVNMSVSMAGKDAYHPYTVYLLKKK